MSGAAPAPEPRAAAGRRAWWVAVVLLAVVAFVAAIAVQRNVFPFYSGDHDEPVVRYQAEMLREGMVTVSAGQQQFFQPWLTGVHDGRLVPAFQPLWPAALMVADVATGSMLPALGLAAALLTVATYLLARELLVSRARAVLAAALVTCSPFVLMLSGTYLSYVVTAAIGTLLATAVARGVRTGSRAMYLGAGALAGAAFLSRPYDAVLYVLPLAGYLVAAHRHDLTRLAAVVGWIVLGSAPLVAVALAYNVALTGSPLAFGTSVQSEGTSAFFFGTRSIAPGTPTLEFTPSFAASSLGRNLWAVPTWMAGTYLAVAAAAYGAVRLWATRRRTSLLLLALTFAFPLGYLIWWASALTVGGALNGLGPHYYLPMFVPLALLTATGVAEVYARVRRRRALLAVGTVVVVLVLTAVALPPKLGDKSRLASASRHDWNELNAGLADDRGRVLVVQERRSSPFVMEPYPFLANDPRLQNRRLYALDRGAAGIDLVDRHPRRTAYRIVRQVEPGQPIDRIPLVVERQTVVRGPAVTATTRVTNVDNRRRVVAYARFGDFKTARLLDDASTAGATYDLTWTVTPTGIAYAGPAAAEVPYPAIPPRSEHRLKGLAPPPAYGLVIGAAFADSARAGDAAAAVEHDYYARVGRSSQVEVLSAGEEWTRLGPPFRAWLPIAVGRQLDVTLAPAST